MITLSVAQWGNEITLKYAHKEPTPLDLRRMAHLLQRKAMDCICEARKLEDAEDPRRRVEDETLP